MRNRKSVDEVGIPLEMVKYIPEELHQIIIDVLNKLMFDGIIPKIRASIRLK